MRWRKLKWKCVYCYLKRIKIQKLMVMREIEAGDPKKNKKEQNNDN